MRTLLEHIDDLDRLVDNGADKPKIRSQIAFIGREVAALQADYGNLSEAFQKLTAELATKLEKRGRAEAEKEASENQIPNKELDTVEIQILNLFSSASTSNQRFSEEEIAKATGLHPHVADQMLERLLERGFLHRGLRMGSPSSWRLAKKGRDYLIEHKMLKP